MIFRTAWPQLYDFGNWVLNAPVKPTTVIFFTGQGTWNQSVKLLVLPIKMTDSQVAQDRICFLSLLAQQIPYEWYYVVYRYKWLNEHVSWYYMNREELEYIYRIGTGIQMQMTFSFQV